MKRLILTGMMLLTCTAWGGESVLNGKAPHFTLQDQYEKTISLRQFEGRVVVLIASDKEGKAQNAAWDKAVRDRYADRVLILGIADVSSVPFFLKGKIRNDLKKDGESILMDWKAEVFKAYGLAAKVSNIVVIDKAGIVQYLHSGAAETAALEAALRAIDRALE